MKAVRIWIYFREGIVRIEVPPDREICLHSGGRNEEGYQYLTERYFLSHEGILCYSWEMSARDCDGFHSERRSFVAAGGVEPMRGVSKDGRVVLLEEQGPVWERQ